MTNVLKKVTHPNPLAILGLQEDLEIHNACSTDQELTDFYHDQLAKADYLEKIGEPHKDRRKWIYAMINFSTGRSVNVEMLLNQ